MSDGGDAISLMRMMRLLVALLSWDALTKLVGPDTGGNVRQ